MADYSFPTIKTTDLPEVSTMGEVKEIIVNTTTEKNKVIPKAAFTLPQNQITGLTDALAALDGATDLVQTNLEAEILERTNADNLKANISDIKKGYLFAGIATTSTVPPTYTANDRVYYSIDCPASATTLTLTNFAPPTGGVVIPILTVPTRYSLRWGGTAWSGVVDKASNVSQTVGDSLVNAPCEKAVKDEINALDANIESRKLSTDILQQTDLFSLQLDGAILSGDKLVIQNGSAGYSSRIGRVIPDKYKYVSLTVKATKSITGCSIFVTPESGVGFQLVANPVWVSDGAGAFIFTTYVSIPLGGAKTLMLQKGDTSVMTEDVSLSIDELIYIDNKSLTDILNSHESAINGIIPIIITARRDGVAGVDADFVGRRSIQDAIDSITDASENKQYVVRVLEGVYEATQPSHFDSITQMSVPFYSFIKTKDYVSIKGVNRDTVIIKGFLNDTGLGAGFDYSKYQTMYHHSNNNTVEDVTVYGQNLRYPIHIDNGAIGCRDYYQVLKGLRVRHFKNTLDALASWGAFSPIGLGLSDGHSVVIDDSIIYGVDNSVQIHTNANFSKPSQLKYRNCQLIGEKSTNGVIASISPCGSGKRDKLIIENSNLDSGYIYYNASPWIPENLSSQYADHAEIDLIMPDISPRAFLIDLCKGFGLKIASKDTTSASTVRFDQTSTAFPLIISDVIDSAEVTNKYNRKQIYGYQYKDGGDGLVGYAIGKLDIGSPAVGAGANKYITSLGKRLGDCSVINKTLTVIINGTSYSIVFNKNYNGTAATVAATYTNTQIIAEIMSVIGAVANVTEYVVAFDYYPVFKGMVTIKNTDITMIEAGMGIVFDGWNGMKKATNANGRIDGIVLDDCRLGDYGRVITSGEIWVQRLGYRYAIKEVSSAVRETGVELGISATVPGKFDVNASPKLLRAVARDILKILNNN